MAIAYKADIALAHKSGIAADVTHMGIYLATGVAATPTDFDNMRDNIDGFFNNVASGAAAALHVYLAAAISTLVDAHEIRFYEMPATRGPLGSPVAVRTFDTTTVGTTGLPDEVAACLSYQRAYGSDVEFGSGGMRPRARDRGRIYLGPLVPGALELDPVTKESRFGLGGQLLDIGVLAAKDYFGTHMVAADIQWVHFSHAEWSFDAVTRCWMDNACDIQRRRGVAPTAIAEQTL